MTYRIALLASAALLMGFTMAQAQDSTTANNGTTATAPAEAPAAATKSVLSFAPQTKIQYFRPFDQRGLNIFEAPKTPGAAYEGFALQFGASFAQQFQSLRHENQADPRIVNNVDANELMLIGDGFNNAVANLYLNAQVAPGIRVALTSYLSSRHHNETWVKDGYILIDESPFDVKVLQDIMKVVTLKIGHFEINFGDAHFRRSDNGNAIYNPFVGNLITDAFTTEIGTEIYVRKGPFLAMGSVTGGEIRGTVTKPVERGPAYMAKLGFDNQFTDDFRVRLTGSIREQKTASSNTFYGGDRAGSRYYFVMENTAATEAAQQLSGLINPGFRDNVSAYMINPFVQIKGLELFGVIEQATGKAATETADREWNQLAVDAVYRFLPEKQLYVGGRYNTADGQLAGITNDVSVDRVQVAAGWFLTPNLLLKGEWVKQQYNDFPATDIRSKGLFRGFMFEAVVSF
jgi:hypothetical protein